MWQFFFFWLHLRFSAMPFLENPSIFKVSLEQEVCVCVCWDLNSSHGHKHRHGHGQSLSYIQDRLRKLISLREDKDTGSY